MNNNRIEITYIPSEPSIVEQEMKKVGVSPPGIEIMKQKINTYILKVDNVNSQIANISKQMMLTCGGDVAVCKDTCKKEIQNQSVIFIGTLNSYKKFFQKASSQITSIKGLAVELENTLKKLLKVEPPYFCWRNRKYEIIHPMIMGILNITPDSFYDGGRHNTLEKAIDHAKRLLDEGADIIDIGGASSRPNAPEVSEEEELTRVIKVIEKISSFTDAISIDTFRSKVAEEAIKAGATMINDISAGRIDPDILKVCKKYNVPIILMHMKGTPQTMQHNVHYEDFFYEIIKYFHEAISQCLKEGIPYENIIIDPGIGFGKSVNHNYWIIKQLSRFKIFRRPILIGISRKSLIGKIDGSSPEERLEASLGLGAIAIYNGADILRVHDVKETKKVVRIIDFLKKVKYE